MCIFPTAENEIGCGKINLVENEKFFISWAEEVSQEERFGGCYIHSIRVITEKFTLNANFINYVGKFLKHDQHIVKLKKSCSM